MCIGVFSLEHIFKTIFYFSNRFTLEVVLNLFLVVKWRRWIKENNNINDNNDDYADNNNNYLLGIILNCKLANFEI